MFKLVELVEEKMNNETKAAPIGTIMHDVWTRFLIHCIGLCACCNETVNGETKPTKALLSVTPMPQVPEDDSSQVNCSELEQESTVFNAEAHANFVHTTFKEFHLTVQLNKWLACQITDDTATNRKMACDVNIKQIGCESHLLNLNVNGMIKTDDCLF